MVESTRRSLIARGMAAGVGSLVARNAEAQVIEPKTTTEELMYTTARIVRLDAKGTTLGTGTGFFYSFPAPGSVGRFVPLLVTNKHVIQGATYIEFTVHTASERGAAKPNGKFKFRAEASGWVPHPDPKVDLCAAPIGQAIDDKKVFYRTFGPDDVPTGEQLEGLSAVEEILMVGYPRGLWDEINNYPLIRRGITASHPAVDYMVDGAPTIVIDAACFPGSSGSPVVLHNVGSYTDKKSGSLKLGSRTLFLGVLFSGPVYKQDGKIVIRTIPTGEEPVPVINLMMNLGYIVKARELAALCAAVMAKYPITPAPK